MEEKDIYRTIKKASTGEYKDKGSKFIAYAFEIDSEQDFKNHLDEVKKEHFKARHHCYAFAIGPDRKKYRYNDDGEPGGTAGLPIYNQIKSKELSNIGVIVVRYFGGTKLGISGLINAYKNSTKLALENADIVEKYIEDTVSIKYDYKFTGEIMKVINNTNAIIIANNFDLIPQVIIKIRKSETSIFIKSIYSAILKRSIEDIEDDEKIEGIEIVISN